MALKRWARRGETDEPVRGQKSHRCKGLETLSCFRAPFGCGAEAVNQSPAGATCPLDHLTGPPSPSTCTQYCPEYSLDDGPHAVHCFTRGIILCKHTPKAPCSILTPAPCRPCLPSGCIPRRLALCKRGARRGGMASEPYHEPRESHGIMERSATANGASRAAKEDWYHQKNAHIKYQPAVGGYGLSRADPTALRGESKLETGTVRNNPIHWQALPEVSDLHFDRAYMNNALPRHQIPLHRSLPASFLLSTIVSTQFFSSIVTL
jgi:hypothetical protein